MKIVEVAQLIVSVRFRPMCELHSQSKLNKPELSVISQRSVRVEKKKDVICIMGSVHCEHYAVY